MITVGEYVKRILKARNMTQIDLVKEINRRHLGYNGNDVKKAKINNFLNGTWHKNYPMARRCEIALDLPKYSLIITPLISSSVPNKDAQSFLKVTTCSSFNGPHLSLSSKLVNFELQDTNVKGNINKERVLSTLFI